MLQSPMKSESIWNIPITFTSMIGREQEVGAICALLLRPDVRLLTLLGPGGIGKTRLILQVATQMRERFTDGVCWIGLAVFSDPQLLIPNIAQELGIRETGDVPLLEQVKFALREKHLLLLLDNFEHLMMLAPLVEELLVACPLVKIMVTSREVLHLPAEHLYDVPPLTLPDLARLPESKLLLQYAAVALFVQRTQTIMPAFQITPTNARAIAEICVRLDGLPLAIEFAAARVRLLSPQALLERLSLDLFDKGPRTVSGRQQTLRNALKWSYDLLDAEEQRHFRRLSVFVGGWALEAVEAVWKAGQTRDYDSVSVLNGITSLLDKSLLTQLEEEGAEPYLIMLKIVREYALERLQESGELEICQRAHALYYLTFVEKAEAQLRSEAQTFWLTHLELEQENLWAALAWLVEHQEAELALRFCAALWGFWHLRGYWSEGRRWLKAALELPSTGEPTLARARALYRAGDMAYYQDDYSAARTLLEESVAICRRLESQRDSAVALDTLGGVLYMQGEKEAARPLFEESEHLARVLDMKWELAALLRKQGQRLRSEGDAMRAMIVAQEALAIARPLNDKALIAITLLTLGDIALLQGDLLQSALYDQEAFTLAQSLNDIYLIAIARHNTGYVASLQGDLAQAAEHMQEVLVLLHKLGDRRSITAVLHTLGHIALLQNNLAQASTWYREGLALSEEINSSGQIGWHLSGLAEVAAAEGKPYQAARLIGCAETRFDARIDMSTIERNAYESMIAKVRSQLGEKLYIATLAEGRAMTPFQALSTPEPAIAPQTPPSSPRPAYPAGLTVAEVEILRLLAQGLSTARIAELRISSPNTVRTQLDSIYRKIGVRSRHEASVYAREKNLI